jgi:hypothetical protein
MAVVQVSARVDGKIRDKAEKVFAQYGLDLSTAIRSMITIAANSKRLPFVIGRPPVSLDGDGFADDTAYFKQIPGYWESIVKASGEPASEGMAYDPGAFWNEA